MFMTCFIFLCIVLCIITNDVLFKLSILHEQSHVLPDINSKSTLPSNNPASFDIVAVYQNAKSSLLSQQVSADIDPEILNRRIITYRMRAPISVSQKCVSTKLRIYKSKINSPQDFLL